MKKIIFTFLAILLASNTVLANEIPINIAPTNVISTKNNDYSVGDKIKFAITKDVYVNKKLYIKAETPVFATVDYYTQNGWCFDKAQLKLTPFKTTDTNGNAININDKLLLEPPKLKAKTKLVLGTKYFVQGITWLIRGREIYIEPDSESYTIYINNN